MSNLLDTLKGLATTELVSAASKSLGESEGGISKAIGGILPSILSGVMNSNSSNHSMIGDLLGQAGGNSNLVGDLIGGLTSGNSNTGAMGIGGSLLKGLFGDKVAGIANLISNFAGIKSSSSSSLLGIGGSLIASFLGKKMLGEGLNFGGIMNWLGGHKNEIASVVPAGFANLMSGGSASATSHVSATTSHTASTVSNNNDDDDNNGGGMKWLLPIILLGLLGVGLFLWLKGNGEKETKEEVATMQHETAEAGNSIANAADHAAANVASAVKGKVDEAGNWIAEKGEAIKIKLDNGTELDATKGSL